MIPKANQVIFFVSNHFTKGEISGLTDILSSLSVEEFVLRETNADTWQKRNKSFRICEYFNVVDAFVYPKQIGF